MTELKTVGDDGRHRGAGERCGSALDWTLRVDGEVQEPKTFSLAQLWKLPVETRTLDVVCVSSGTLTRPKREPVHFAGISLRTLLMELGLVRRPDGVPLAQTVRMVSRAPGSCGPADEAHHTSLPLASILSGETPVLLTGILNDGPLPYANGGPLRSVVWGHYFYKSVKWLSHIELLATPLEQHKGTWEQHAGYHHRGRLDDPKFEPFLTTQDASQGQLEASGARDPEAMKAAFWKVVEGGDLSGLVVARLDQWLKPSVLAADPRWQRGLKWQELDEKGQLIQAAGWRGTSCNRMDLRGWQLSHVNFSLSSFIKTQFANQDGTEGADLRHCDFEGAVFWGACLRDVDMRGAYLSGASFCKESGKDPADVRGLQLEGAGGMDEDLANWLTARGAIGARPSQASSFADQGDLLPCVTLELQHHPTQQEPLQDWLRSLPQSAYAQVFAHTERCLSVLLPAHQRNRWLRQWLSQLPPLTPRVLPLWDESIKWVYVPF